MSQWLARLDHVFAPLRLEKLFLGRNKVADFRVWYRDEMSSYLKEMLLDPLTLQRPYLRAHSLEKIIEGHVTGYRNYTSEINKILMLELIQRKLINLN